MIRQRVSLRVDPPFDLRVAVFGHGWIDLAPHTWDGSRGILRTAARLEGTPADVDVRWRNARLEITTRSDRALTPASIRSLVSQMLRLNEDFRPLWELCRTDPQFTWVTRLGAGRLLRAPTVFEDLSKLLLTTNCSWSATRRMVSDLVERLGEPTPSGRHAFPTPQRCATEPEGFYREQIRAGYRAPFLRELALRATTGALDVCGDPRAPAGELRRALLDLPGFGPYATGQALRLLGHYEDLALDSWCRAKLAERSPRGRVPSTAAITRRYRRFGRYRGLALWLDLTRSWHLEHATLPLAITPQ